MLREKIYELINWKGVVHTTWNPGGPGVVRIHMVPPKFKWSKIIPSIAIINGQDYVPLNESWAILLTEFIAQVNAYGEKDMSEETLEEIIEAAFHRVRKVYPQVDNERLREDLITITDTFEALALGKEPEVEIGQMSIGEYAPYMSAPHRMDLMVSAMEKDGNWNCNQHCIHCYAAGQPLANTKELTTKEWKQIIEKCKEARIPQLTFTGGEPTLRSDLFELIRAARWFVTRLNTNGILLTRQNCEKLKEAELDSVQITFYSCDEAIHNTLVGGAHYAQTLEGIQNAVNSGLSVSINTPLCTLNREYVKTLAFLKELGVGFVTCSGMIITGNAKEEPSVQTRLSREELYQILQEAAAFCNANEMEMSFTSPGWIKDKQLQELGLQVPSCGACLSNMAVTPQGMAVPCQSALSGTPLGNMLTDPFTKIWNNRACKAQRKFSAQIKQLCPLEKKILQ